MPYIDPDKRKDLRPKIKVTISNPGELNYALHQVVDEYLAGQVTGYWAYNDAVGALECVKQELYRRLVAPYEDAKIQENGDVLPYSRKLQ